MVTCSSLIRGERCRQTVERQLTRPPTATLHETVEACAKDYCSRLADPSSVSACQSAGPRTSADLNAAYVDLRRAMLQHDFSNVELPRAAEALMAVSRYVASVPPPSVRSSALDSRGLEVRLKGDGSFLIRIGDGTERTAASLTELPRAVPRCDADRRVALQVDPGREHADVIATMDALRSIGCDQISFARSR